jgi:cell division protein FtsB
VTLARWIALFVIVAAAVFAWNGGTYSHRNYAALKELELADSLYLRQLRHEVDSLRSLSDSLDRDPAVQERVAREEFGMARPGELTFTILTDSTPALARPVARP